MKLNYKVFGQGEPLVIIHGFLGMLDNWQAQAKVFAETHEVVIVDMRNHGHSPHDKVHTYAAMVDDLVELLDELGYESANLLGHSMGGKVVMKFAQLYPERVKKLIVADISPRYYPVHHQKIFAALNAVPLDELSKRTDAEAYMEPFISESGVRQFLMKSLYHPTNDTFGWRFNLNGLEANLDNIGEATDDLDYEGETLFVRGSKSDYITEDDWVDIKVLFPHALIETIENAGHWLHAEQPTAFSKTVLAFLGSQN